jgi:DNA-binding response OmpR family regulator
MNSRHRIALFDDEQANLALYKEMLSADFEVETFQNPFSYRTALKKPYSAIVIDVLMPGMDGIQLYREILKHEDYNHCPILFISADASEEVRFRSLNEGGIDFLQRMMKKEEICIRLRNKISFFEINRSVYKLGSLKLNTKELKVFLKERSVDVTLIELKILKFLIANCCSLRTREEVCQFVWPDQIVQQPTLNTHLSNLRNKFVDWEFDILSIKNKGIQLVPKE